MPDQARVDFTPFFSGGTLVDAAGAPLVLFHGSPRLFESFKLAEHGHGIFFAVRREVAQAYAEGEEGEEGSGHVIAAQLSMHNPAIVDQAFLERIKVQCAKELKQSRALHSARKRVFIDAFEDSETWARDVVVDRLRQLGHDAMIIPNDSLPVFCLGGDWDLQPSVAVFSPNQVLRVPDPLLRARATDPRVEAAQDALEYLACIADRKVTPHA